MITKISVGDFVHAALAGSLLRLLDLCGCGETLKN